MSKPVTDIIKKIAESETKFAIVKLFKENPYVMDNIAGLSLWVGKPTDVIMRELDDLLDMGIVYRWGSEPGAIYSYSRDRSLQKNIAQHWDELDALARNSTWWPRDGSHLEGEEAEDHGRK